MAYVVNPNGSGMVTVQSATVNFSTSGDHPLISAVANKTVQVLGFNLVVAGATTLTWKSSGGSVIMPAQSFSSTGGNETRPLGGFCTSVLGEGITLNLGSAVQVSGPVDYIVY